MDYYDLLDKMVNVRKEIQVIVEQIRENCIFEIELRKSTFNSNGTVIVEQIKDYANGYCVKLDDLAKKADEIIVTSRRVLLDR